MELVLEPVDGEMMMGVVAERVEPGVAVGEPLQYNCCLEALCGGHGLSG